MQIEEIADKREEEIAIPQVWEEYLSTITNKARKRQSRLARLLLLYALKKEGIKADNFVKMQNGRWEIGDDFGERKVDFSISHSYDFVAVALSNTDKIGIDIEKVDKKIIKIKEKLLGDKFFTTEEENAKILAETLTTEWTIKESLYKAELDRERAIINTKVIENNREKYILSVAYSKKQADKECIFYRVKESECIQYI